MKLENEIFSNVIVHGKYARYNPVEKRRETWEELVTRNKEMHQIKFPQLKEEIEEVYKLVYDKKILPIIKQSNPDLFICGHSHILKVMYDKKNQLLHMNPGAIGDYGTHKVKTILCFTIEGKEIKNLRVVEFPRSKS